MMFVILNTQKKITVMLNCCQVQVIEELCLAVDVVVLKSLFLHEQHPLPL